VVLRGMRLRWGRDLVIVIVFIHIPLAIEVGRPFVFVCVAILWNETLAMEEKKEGKKKKAVNG
jgi:hypothetical protein